MLSEKIDVVYTEVDVIEDVMLRIFEKHLQGMKETGIIDGSFGKDAEFPIEIENDSGRKEIVFSSDDWYFGELSVNTFRVPYKFFDDPDKWISDKVEELKVAKRLREEQKVKNAELRKQKTKEGEIRLMKELMEKYPNEVE